MALLFQPLGFLAAQAKALQDQQPRGGRDVAVAMKCDYFHPRDKVGMLRQGLETGWRTQCSWINQGHVQRAQLNLRNKSHESDVS